MVLNDGIWGSKKPQPKWSEKYYIIVNKEIKSNERSFWWSKYLHKGK